MSFARIRVIVAFALLALVAAPRAYAALGGVPSGLPGTAQIGMADSPGGAAAMKACAPFGYRFQYLSGGANTSNWSTWNTNGDFPLYYIQDSAANGIVPVFTLYIMLGATPGAGADDAQKDYGNFNTTATMQAWFANYKLLLQKCALAGGRVIVHIEPDFWGYMENLYATGDDATSVGGKVGSAGGDAAGLPDTLAGFAQALVRMRDQYAPQVLLAYHASTWGAHYDLLLSDLSDPQCAALGQHSAAFYNSLGADFDLIFTEFSDRDSAYFESIGSAWKWYQAADYHRLAVWSATLAGATGKRLVAWQIPYGNTRMRACDDSYGHTQSNEVEWLFDDPTRAHLAEYTDAGFIAFLFSGTISNCTYVGDARGDGVTNPAPIAPDANGTATSPNGWSSALGGAGSAPSFSGGVLTTPYAADDDGGFFRWRSYAYYAAGAAGLPGGSATPAASESKCGLGGVVGLLALVAFARPWARRPQRASCSMRQRAKASIAGSTSIPRRHRGNAS